MIPTIPISSAIPAWMPVAELGSLLGPAVWLLLGGVLVAFLVLIVDLARAPRSDGRLPREVARSAGFGRELGSAVRQAA